MSRSSKRRRTRLILQNLPSDGPHGESPSYDYYATSFAIPFYGIIFSKHCPDHPLAEEWRQRARKLAPRVVHLFAPNGAAIPFGRSMIYRFACVAFWSAVAYAEIEVSDTYESRVPILNIANRSLQLPAPFSLGVIKGIILRHIRWFTKNPEIFHRDGSLCVGWAYPTCYISEVSGGSRSGFKGDFRRSDHPGVYITSGALLGAKVVPHPGSSI